jgi:hypothetical protein
MQSIGTSLKRAPGFYAGDGARLVPALCICRVSPPSWSAIWRIGTHNCEARVARGRRR